MNPWSRQREHPAYVFRRDEVPRRAEHVRADDRTRGELALDVRVGCGHGSLADAPFAANVVLRLDRAEAADHLEWCAQWLDQVLVGETPPRDLARGQCRS